MTLAWQSRHAPMYRPESLKPDAYTFSIEPLIEFETNSP